MSVKSSTELMLYVVLTMPTLNKAYLFIIYYIVHNFGTCINVIENNHIAYRIDGIIAVISFLLLELSFIEHKTYRLKPRHPANKELFPFSSTKVFTGNIPY
jgi:hypothetical protein